MSGKIHATRDICLDFLLLRSYDLDIRTNVIRWT